MPEGNGNERDARLRRIEQEHEDFRRDLRSLLTAQVLQKEEIDDLFKLQRQQIRALELEGERRQALDERVDKLVSAIGELIRRIPPENLKP